MDFGSARPGPVQAHRNLARFHLNRLDVGASAGPRQRLAGTQQPVGLVPIRQFLGQLRYQCCIEKHRRAVGVNGGEVLDDRGRVVSAETKGHALCLAAKEAGHLAPR